MSKKNLILILLMMTNSVFTLLIYNVYNYDILFSISLVLNLFIGFYILLKESPEDHVVKLSMTYLAGFALFICGRYISNIFGVEDIYCIDFGYSYCLNTNEILKLNFLINFSIIFFILGFITNSKKMKIVIKDQNIYINKFILSIIIAICVITGITALYFQLQLVAKTMAGGYLALYENQGEIYQPPVFLLANTIFIASLAVIYSVKEYIKSIIFYALIAIFVISQFLTVLTGARAGFITALIVLLWMFLGKGRLNFKKVAIIISALFLVFLTNYFASLSGARLATSDGGFYQKIVVEVFYSQGFSLMVFSLGTLEDFYPLLAYLKTIFPGIQIFYSFFTDISQYELSFSQNLAYKLAPSVYYNNMGWGWSLLGDFYAFSFGLSAVFLFYNFFWGRLIFRISMLNNINIYYRGLFFCFLITVFGISRTSISYLIFLVALYSLFHLSTKLKARV